MFCPQCHAEYREGFTTCADCAIPLVDEVPPDVRDTALHVVFRTGRSYELMLATDALTRAGVPHYTQEEDVSGVRVAQPLTPVMGPGVWWSVLVPEVAVADARNLLAELPVEVGTEPDIWHFGPSREAKSYWRFYAMIMLLGTLVGYVMLFFDAFRGRG